MRAPRKPPSWADQLAKLTPDRMFAVVTAPDLAPAHSSKLRYLHWDKMVYLKPPSDFTHTEWWTALKLGRHRLYRDIPLLDTSGQTFRFLVTDPIPEALHNIDLGAGGTIGIPQQVVNPETRDQFYISSLIEEAITSSQLEGATTTREVAKEMIRAARPPRDRSEQMILNNFMTMQRINELKHKPITKELIFEIHRIVTENTLDNADAVGRFRTADESIVVGDEYGNVFHEPPPSAELNDRFEKLCEFANGGTPGYFIHPAIRAIILHFWLAYDHPFIDGNGRTARALFYWAMLHYGFWVCEYLSISHIIHNAPAKYGRAFLYTENDENDLTHFIVYHVDVLVRALRSLEQYVRAKSERVASIERQMRNTVLLNHRQASLISHALRHPYALYSTDGHRMSHRVSFPTARADLMDLSQRGLLRMVKSGRTSLFTPVDDIESILSRRV